jgi:hypothetical protein
MNLKRNSLCVAKAKFVSLFSPNKAIIDDRGCGERSDFTFNK